MFRNARARNTHVEANLNHSFPAQALAPSASALGLATAKAGWEAAFALGGVAFLALATPFEGGRRFLEASRTPEEAASLGAAVLWCGAATCGAGRG